MSVETLEELAAAVKKWRKEKRYLREAMPEELWERAVRAADQYGVTQVSRATNIERCRVVERSKRSKESGSRGITFSRFEISAPSTTILPIAEVETATGVKFRVFNQTPEMLSVLTSLCGMGSGS